MIEAAMINPFILPERWLRRAVRAWPNDYLTYHLLAASLGGEGFEVHRVVLPPSIVHTEKYA